MDMGVWFIARPRLVLMMMNAVMEYATRTVKMNVIVLGAVATAMGFKTARRENRAVGGGVKPNCAPWE